MNWLLRQLGQESTWRGMIQGLTAIGVAISPQNAETIISVGLGLVGAINFIKNSAARR